MELPECLSLANKSLQELFGEGYEKKSIHTIYQEIRRKARAIIRSLKPFAQRDTFPLTYNPRAVHALFALAFLYYSRSFFDFIWVVRMKAEPKTENMESAEFVVYMLETIKMYKYMAQYREGTIRLYDEMTPLFKKAHAARGMSGFVEDQLVVVIDFTNPISHIKTELEELLKKTQHHLDGLAVELAEKMTAGAPPPDLDKVLPSRHAAPVKDETDNPEKYFPQWYQALVAHRAKLLKHGEQDRIKFVCRVAKSIDNTNDSGKTTAHNRSKLAERLIHCAYRRIPMTAFHTKASCL